MWGGKGRAGAFPFILRTPDDRHPFPNPLPTFFLPPFPISNTIPRPPFASSIPQILIPDQESYLKVTRNAMMSSLLLCL